MGLKSDGSISAARESNPDLQQKGTGLSEPRPLGVLEAGSHVPFLLANQECPHYPCLNMIGMPDGVV